MNRSTLHLAGRYRGALGLCLPDRLLRQTRPHIKFLPLEPLLTPMPKLKLNGINWVIVGDESGPGARPMAECWVMDICDQCLNVGVAFHFKQWGGVFKKRNGRILEGRTWNWVGSWSGARPSGAIEMANGTTRPLRADRTRLIRAGPHVAGVVCGFPATGDQPGAAQVQPIGRWRDVRPL
jgi:hypothetical protein